AMLLLMKDLTERAAAGPEAVPPVPVPFSLAGFDGQRADLADWLLDELHSRYRVPRATARRWLKDRRIIPLLDGLDECRPEVRARCADSINRFRRERTPPGLVVTSRLDEYLQGTRLELAVALRLHELTTLQVREYIHDLPASGTPLAALLDRDPSL